MRITFSVVMDIPDGVIIHNAESCNVDIDQYRKGLVADKLDILEGLVDDYPYEVDKSRIGVS